MGYLLRSVQINIKATRLLSDLERRHDRLSPSGKRRANNDNPKNALLYTMTYPGTPTAGTTTFCSACQRYA